MPFTVTTESGQVIGTESGRALATDPLDIITPQDIITLALKSAGVLGIGQTASYEDINDSFTLLNFMLAQWNKKRWLVYVLKTYGVQCVGKFFYTVGPGGDINCPRPDRLEDAFFRQNIPSMPNQIDYPLELIESRETYNKIALKQLNSFPSYIFYESDYPLGRIYPWPLPSNLYEVFISIKAHLYRFTSLAQEIQLPPEYHAAILYNLSNRLRTAFQLPPDMAVVSLAKDALNVIRGANAQVSRLRMPTDLIRPGIYNPYSDQIR